MLSRLLQSLVRSTVLCSVVALASPAFAEALSPEMTKKLDAKLPEIQAWGKEASIVNAVKKHNESPSADAKAMTQEKWQGLSVLDPALKALTKNEASDFLKTKKGLFVTEAFVSGADGTKVAMLSKSSSWSHKGKAKHEDPMANKTWRGEIEVDESTSLRQVQVSVPVLDGDKPIGSLVVGVDVEKL